MSLFFVLLLLAGPVPTRPPGTSVPDLQGRWKTVEAKMNGETVPDQKIFMTWWFRGDELYLTNGEGSSARFIVHEETPGTIRLEPGGSGEKEKGGVVLWKRDGDDRLLAFNDNLNGRPDGWAPSPKKIVMRVRRAGSA